MDDALSPVPMLDLKAQYAAIKPEIDAAIEHVVASQHFINGPEVEVLEADIAQYCKAKHCIGVSSGSDALLVALMALGIGPKDEVITTPYTFFATVGAIVRLGARPVFADIDPVTFNINPAEIACRVTSRTRAIIPVHLFGQCADMDPILEIARRHKLAVIEDAAQALGAEYKGRRAGSMGTVGCFSFFPSKNLGAFGDAGAVITNDAALADKIRLLRGHGSNPKYYHQLVGGNFRLDALQAAVLRVKLKYLDAWTARRQENASWYDAALGGDFRLLPYLQTPMVMQSRHIFNQYVVRFHERDALAAHLKKKQIGCEVYYPQPMHLQECFLYLGHVSSEFPESEVAAQTTLALPVYPELTADQLNQVANSVTDFYDQAGRTLPRAA